MRELKENVIAAAAYPDYAVSTMGRKRMAACPGQGRQWAESSRRGEKGGVPCPLLGRCVFNTECRT